MTHLTHKIRTKFNIKYYQPLVLQIDKNINMGLEYKVSDLLWSKVNLSVNDSTTPINILVYKQIK